MNKLFGIDMPMPEEIRANIANRLFSNSPVFGGPMGPAYTAAQQIGRGLGFGLAGPGKQEQDAAQVQQIMASLADEFDGDLNDQTYKAEVMTTAAKRFMEAGRQDIALQIMDKIPQEAAITAKDIAPISKEVTATIKTASDVRSKAATLDRLAKSGTTTDVIASAFIFMKALDPTSTVRETEQGQVYAAEGKGAELAAFMNSLTGDPRLDKPKLEKLAATAKRLANQQIQTADTDLNSMISGYRGTRLDRAGYLDKQLKRMPKPFEITWTEGQYEYRELPDGTVQRRLK